MPSTPTRASARPIASAATPLTAESATTAAVAMNATTARAKYSAGPNTVARSASTGAKKTTRMVARMPPVKAPMAAVARAWGARPLLAIRCPSNVDAMAVELPGVFIRIAVVESPNSPP